LAGSRFAEEDFAVEGLEVVGFEVEGLAVAGLAVAGLAGAVKVSGFRTDSFSRRLSMPWALTGVADTTANREAPARTVATPGATGRRSRRMAGWVNPVAGP
jgi:hypothetical protein